MKFKMPTASRKRLEELLEYLGKTENYSRYYNGNRAEDFKKCFDIESEWCWKYADLVLRGLEKRPAKPGDEGHHAVPRSFYGVGHNCNKIDAGNLFTLSYVEHVLVHYCACYCATGKMQGKMARAFIIMYRLGIRNKHALIPSDAELLDAIPEMELIRIQAMEPRWAKVEAEGRTHLYEDPKQYKKDYYEANREKKKDYYEANREKIMERERARYESNREQLLEQHKAYYETNREKILEQKKAYGEANKEKLAEKNKAYYEASREKILERKKAYGEANKEKIAEKNKAYYEANKEKLAEKNKAYREANKEKLAEKNKAYREANKEKLAEHRKAFREAKKSAGYRYRKNPITGNYEWIFVGLPATPETTKTTSGAA